MEIKRVGVIVWADEAKSHCEVVGPFEGVVGRDVVVDRVAKLFFADGTSRVIENAIGYVDSSHA